MKKLLKMPKLPLNTPMETTPKLALKKSPLPMKKKPYPTPANTLTKLPLKSSKKLSKLPKKKPPLLMKKLSKKPEKKLTLTTLISMLKKFKPKLLKFTKKLWKKLK